MNPLKANRNIEDLRIVMQKRVRKFLKDCKDAGIEVFITEGKRTQARQVYLYSFGRFGENKTGSKVTWTMKSKHLEGMAIDIAFKKEGDIYVGRWEDVFDIAEANGLESLYRRSGKDKPHLQYDEKWVAPLNRKEDERFLMDKGIVKTAKDIDGVQNREEAYAIQANIYKSLTRKIKSLERKIKKLEKQ